MATGLELHYSYKTRPPAFIHSLFMSTVNMASKTLVAVASSSKLQHSEKWSVGDHLRFMVMLMTWATLWVLRVLMDNIPCLRSCSTFYMPSIGSLFDLPPLLGGSSTSSTAALSIPASSTSSLDMILHGGYGGPSFKPLNRALSHVLALLNEIPATSRKYQFTMMLADRIMEENLREGHVDLLHVNRTALSSAFARTSTLLYRSLRKSQSGDSLSAWPTRVIRSLPMGKYMVLYLKGMKFCVGAALRYMEDGTLPWNNGRQLVVRGGSRGEYGDLAAEKLAPELLWLTYKLREFGAVDEALEQWGYASGLASMALEASPRVQAFIIKIYAILFIELARERIEIPREVKYGLLGLWLPLCCYASNGLTYPMLSGLEKLETERAMDQVISTLPPIDQEVILTNWLQDFAISSSDWPNLQVTYDRWCRCTREWA